ncbi:MAG: helix-turn-helix transcriptional regulator [Clostridiales bacterium]|nr:helix-turn-helix transcriptional regulator [Clostridiales bacterium]
MAGKFSTDVLLKRLFKTTSISRFLNRYGDNMKRAPLNIYINQICEAKGIAPEHIIRKSGMSRSYGYQIFSGIRKPSRDKVLQLAVSFEMDYDETQELLRTARKSPLYPKVERDAAIIYALHKKLNIAEVQALLNELALPLLGEDDRCEN